MHLYNDYKQLPKELKKEFEKPPCECCGITDDVAGVLITEHHVYPQRWKWELSIEQLAVWLCQACHGRIEDILFRAERDAGSNPNVTTKLDEGFYSRVTLHFLTEPSVLETTQTEE